MRNMKIILASASPRRKQILTDLNIDFDIIVSDVDESIINGEEIGAEMFVQELALLKATAAGNKAKEQGSNDSLVVAADTVVCLAGKILGKPSDEKEAFSMLCSLSDTVHEVYTGICILRLGDGFAATEVCKTSVRFKTLSDEKIKAYIKTKEPMDKAGAYGIQGYGAILVKEIQGDYFNVMGLPIATLADLLEKEFDLQIF